jgi:hypothetical protein
MGHDGPERVPRQASALPNSATLVLAILEKASNAKIT